MKCLNCMNEIPADSKFCPDCGNPIKGTSEGSPSGSESGADTLEFTVGGVSFKMIHVDGGTFTMGTTRELEDSHNNVKNVHQDAPWYSKPAHRVTLTDDYYIGETQVTQALWKAVMGSNPSYFKGDNLPVEQVSWNDCQNFIEELNRKTSKHFRLPTEAEWEFAARGGNDTCDYLYSGSDYLDDVAWYSDNSDGETHPVKVKKSNELGIYDMSGNVCEWCQDWYGDYSSNSQTNPTGSSARILRICRGGDFGCFFKFALLSCRSCEFPERANSLTGFRLALSE